MPRSEEIAAWAATRAASREPYPRKNVYFVGEGQEEIYDYLIWRANVRGYRTIEGEPVRGSAELIHDVLKRLYLRDMLDQGTADDFAAWRRQQYVAAGVAVDDASPKLAPRRPYSSADMAGYDPRFSAFMRARWPVPKSIRAAIWHRQNGKCAVCRAERRLKVYSEVPPPSDAASHVITGRNMPPSEGDDANLTAVCEACRRRTPDRFAEARGSAV